MKEYELEKFRKEYNKLKQQKDEALEIQRELIELSKNKDVKRYLELIEILDFEYKAPSDEELIKKAYSNRVTSSHIMVYMGSYVYNSVLRENNDYITFDDDPEASYKAYLDLETMQAYNILIDDCEEFEENNLTIYIPVRGYTSSEYSKNYFDLRNWFLKQLINKDQKDVIEDLKKIKESKYQKLFIATHNYPEIHLNVRKIGMVDELDLEEFVNNHSEGGFVEKFCLSEEEQRRVRLYRKNNQKK